MSTAILSLLVVVTGSGASVSVDLRPNVVKVVGEGGGMSLGEVFGAVWRERKGGRKSRTISPCLYPPQPASPQN